MGVVRGRPTHHSGCTACILTRSRPFHSPSCRFLRGEAHAAEDGHPAQDWGAAAGCFVRAVDLDPVHPDYALRLADAAGELNNAQLSGVLDAVYVARGGAGGQAAAALGLADVPTGEAHRCVVTLRFPKVRCV